MPDVQSGKVDAWRGVVPHVVGPFADGVVRQSYALVQVAPGVVDGRVVLQAKRKLDTGISKGEGRL